jgi:hypothetical protein
MPRDSKTPFRYNRVICRYRYPPSVGHRVRKHNTYRYISGPLVRYKYQCAGHSVRIALSLSGLSRPLHLDPEKAALPQRLGELPECSILGGDRARPWGNSSGGTMSLHGNWRDVILIPERRRGCRPAAGTKRRLRASGRARRGRMRWRCSRRDRRPATWSLSLIFLVCFWSPLGRDLLLFFVFCRSPPILLFFFWCCLRVMIYSHMGLWFSTRMISDVLAIWFLKGE